LDKRTAAQAGEEGKPCSCYSGFVRVLVDLQDETEAGNQVQSYSLVQLYDGRSGSAFVLGRGFKAGDVRMIFEKVSHRFAQGAGSVAVNYAHFAQAVQESVVKKLVREIDCLVSGLSDEVQFG